MRWLEKNCSSALPPAEERHQNLRSCPMARRQNCALAPAPAGERERTGMEAPPARARRRCPPLDTQPPENPLRPLATWVRRKGMGEQPPPWGRRLSPNGWLQGCTVPGEPARSPRELRCRDTVLYNLSAVSISCPWLSGALSLLN